MFLLLACESNQQKTAKILEKYRADSIRIVKTAKHKMDSLRVVLDSINAAHGVIGDWIIKAYIDDAGKPLKKNYMTTFRPIQGTFSNNTSNNDSLRIEFLIDSKSFSFQLYEKNGNIPVNANLINLYDVKVLCEGEQFEVKVKNFSDRLHFDEKDAQKLIVLFLKNRPVKFSVVPSSGNHQTSYQFTVKSTEGFSSALKKLID